MLHDLSMTATYNPDGTYTVLVIAKHDHCKYRLHSTLKDGRWEPDFIYTPVEIWVAPDGKQGGRYETAVRGNASARVLFNTMYDVLEDGMQACSVDQHLRQEVASD